MTHENKKQEHIRLEEYLSEHFCFRLNEITGSIEFRKKLTTEWEELNEFNIYRQLKLEGFRSNLNELIYLFPYESEQFWETMRSIIRDEVTKTSKEKSDAPPHATPRLTYKPLLKIAELCTFFHVSSLTVYDWIKHGKLKPYKFAAVFFFFGMIFSNSYRNDTHSKTEHFPNGAAVVNSASKSFGREMAVLAKAKVGRIRRPQECNVCFKFSELLRVPLRG